MVQSLHLFFRKIKAAAKQFPRFAAANLQLTIKEQNSCALDLRHKSSSYLRLQRELRAGSTCYL